MRERAVAAAADPPGAERRGATALRAAAICGAAALSYLPVLSAGLVFDDHLLLGPGALVHGPLRELWLSTKGLDWWPLTYTSLWLDSRLWGGAPLPMHVENVLLHAASAILLWRVLRALEVPGAFLAGLLFAVHPVAVESVAWLSERKNVLSAPLFLGAALWWLRFEARGSRRAWLGSLGLFALALLAKTSTVMLPVVLLGAAWTRGTLDRRAVARLAPMFGMSLAAGLVTVWFQANRAAEGFLLPPRGALERLGGAAWALATYLETAFVPVRAALVYPPWPAGPRELAFFLPLAGIAAVAVALWRARRGWGREVALALGYHAVMVLPVLGLVDLAYLHVGPVSNHLQYLALAGPIALVAAAASRLAARAPRAAAWGAAAGVTLALGGWTARRAEAFHDDVSYWRAAVRDAPGSLYAVWMLSDRLAEGGDRAAAREVLARAAEGSPDPATRLRARALSLFHARRVEEALAAARAADAVRADPGFQLQLASLTVRAGRGEEALALLGPLLESGARSPELWYWTAAALAQRGRAEDAVRTLRDGLRVVPSSVALRLALAHLLVRSGELEEARTLAAAALGVAPGDPAVDAELAATGGRAGSTGRSP